MLEAAYDTLSRPSNSFFLVVAGNIGSGKTSLTKKLAEKLDWRPYFESVQDNPYLEDFYRDMNRWSFPLQVFFLNHRFQTHKFIEQSRGSSIQDRSIYEDANIFARALFEDKKLTARDYENYLQLYRSMTSYLNPPGLMIFLRRSVPKLIERIQLRGREFERNISADYLERLNGYYDHWFENYKLGASILIDTDELDFLENEEHFDQLVHKLYDSFQQRDFFFQ